MFKKIIPPAVLFILPLSIIAQPKKPAGRQAPVSKQQWTLNTGIWNFGLGTEINFSPKSTIVIEGGVGWNRTIYKIPNSYNIQIDFPALYFSVNPRLYYNMNKRIKKGANTSFNAANYIGLKTRISSTSTNEDFGTGSVSAELLWGIQRNLGKSWLVDFHTGIGANNSPGYGTYLYPAFNLRFAKRIFRK